MIGPDLSTTGTCLKPEEVVESMLWPRRQVKEGYAACTVVTSDGKIRQGYKLAETPKEIVFRDPASTERFQVARADIDEIRQDGTLMPDGLTAAMSPAERRDLVRFLFDLGRTGSTAAEGTAPAHRTPWPSLSSTGVRATPSSGRTGSTRSIATAFMSIYSKEAAHFANQPGVPSLLPPFPGLDGGKNGHWGNQNEQTWADSRWNQTDLGTVLSGVFRARA